MGYIIIGPDGIEETPKNDVIKPVFEIPKNEVNPGLEIIKPDIPLSKTPPFPIPFNIPPVKRDIDEILGNN